MSRYSTAESRMRLLQIQTICSSDTPEGEVLKYISELFSWADALAARAFDRAFDGLNGGYVLINEIPRHYGTYFLDNCRHRSIFKAPEGLAIPTAEYLSTLSKLYKEHTLRISAPAEA